MHDLGWREAALSDGRGIARGRPDAGAALDRTRRPRDDRPDRVRRDRRHRRGAGGDTVFVSGAAGAVGSVAGAARAAARRARRRRAPARPRRSPGSASSGVDAASTTARRARATRSASSRRTASTSTSTTSAARRSRPRSARCARTVGSPPAARSRATTRPRRCPGRATCSWSSRSGCGCRASSSSTTPTGSRRSWRRSRRRVADGTIRHRETIVDGHRACARGVHRDARAGRTSGRCSCGSARSREAVPLPGPRPPRAGGEALLPHAAPRPLRALRQARAREPLNRPR